MSSQMAYVYIDLRGEQFLVGRLWAHNRKGRESASFEYAENWLTHPDRFPLEPLLKLSAGTFHSADKSMFGAIGDSAPDRWGRVLMRRAANRRTQLEGQTARALMEMDYLLGVNDEARQGALRFALQEGGPYLSSNTTPIPPFIDLPKLLSASDNVLNEKESDQDLRLLLAPGSSLGGARPKASVRDKDGKLALAKFPHKDDEFSTVLWEAVALTLAEKAGIKIPRWRIEKITDRPVILLTRFDRLDQERIPYLSAMSMLGAKDNEEHSYLEIIDAIRQYGAAPKEDIAALFRRIAFNVLISNTDDHLRNHAFLYHGPLGWRLSPAYDLNPVPVEIKPRILTTLIDLNNGTASLELLMSVVEDFGLKKEMAEDIISEVGKAVAQWRGIAKKIGVSQNEIERMSSAFEHRDLEQAL